VKDFETFWKKAELAAYYRFCDRKAIEGKWWTFVAGGGLFVLQNYYGYGPINGCTNKERVVLGMKNILAWNKWKISQCGSIN